MQRRRQCQDITSKNGDTCIAPIRWNWTTHYKTQLCKPNMKVLPVRETWFVFHIFFVKRKVFVQDIGLSKATSELQLWYMKYDYVPMTLQSKMYACAGVLLMFCAIFIHFGATEVRSAKEAQHASEEAPREWHSTTKRNPWELSKENMFKSKFTLVNLICTCIHIRTYIYIYASPPPKNLPFGLHQLE